MAAATAAELLLRLKLVNVVDDDVIDELAKLDAEVKSEKFESKSLIRNVSWLILLLQSQQQQKQQN